MTSADGKVELVVPPGALSSPVTIVMGAATGLPQAVSVVAAVDLRPDGLTFALPATLTIRYDPASLPSGYTQNHLLIAVARNGMWVMLPGTPAPGGGEISADITHFSAYGVIVPEFNTRLTAADWLDAGDGGIDPLPLKLTASDAEEHDRFGYSVAVSGSLAVVGAPLADDGQGAAYVFVRKDGVWEEEAVLTPPAPAAFPSGGHGFGRSVAISGSTLIVGAPGHDFDLRHLGSVFVFVRSHTGLTPQWMVQQTLVSPKPWPTYLLPGGNRFGYSVAVAGDMAIVGEPIDIEIRHEGYYWPTAHIFVRDGSTWTHEETLNKATGTDFGCSVALSGDTAIIGARASPPGGAAHVFVRAHTGLVPVWMEQAVLTASDGEWTDWFGSSVAIEDDLALVGAPAFEPGMGGTPSGRAGAAYVFTRQGSEWTEVDGIAASDGVADDRFGNAVAITNGTLTVGAPYGETSSRSGFVYRFGRAHTGSAPLWLEQQKLSPFDGAAGDQFGHCLAISSDTMLVGAPSENEKGDNAGAVYGFSKSDLVVTAGNVDGPGGARGLLQVFRTPLSVEAAPTGSVMAGEGTSFHGVRLMGPLGIGPDNWARAVLVAVTQPEDPLLPPVNRVRVYDLSDPDAPALVSTGEIPAPSSPLPEEDRSRYMPAIDVVETGAEAFRVYALAPHDADQTGLCVFDFGPNSADVVLPIHDIRFDGRAKDVRVLPDGRVAVLIRTIEPVGTIVRLYAADLGSECCQVAIPGGAVFARGDLLPGEPLIVVDHESGALHLLDVSAADTLALDRTVSGIPTPVAAYRTSKAVCVATVTEGILALDPDTFDPLSFDFQPADAGSCGGVIVSGDALLAVMHSPEMAFPVSAPFDTD